MSSEQKPPRVCWLHPNAIDTLADNGAEYRAAIASKRDATLESWTGETKVIERPAWIQLIEATPEVLAAREMEALLTRLGAMRGKLMSIADMEGLVCKLADEANALLGRIRAGEKGSAKDPRYNWESEGPGGCDSHSVNHPCGWCAKEAKQI